MNVNANKKNLFASKTQRNQETIGNVPERKTTMKHVGKQLCTGALSVLSLIGLNTAFAQAGMSDYEYISTYLLASSDYQPYIVDRGVYGGMDYVVLDYGDGSNDTVFSTSYDGIDMLVYDIYNDSSVDAMRLKTNPYVNYYDGVFLPSGDISNGTGKMYLDSDLDGVLDTVAFIENGSMVEVGYDPEQDGSYAPASYEQEAIIVEMVSVVVNY